MTAVDYTREALIELVEGVPKGTNVGLMQMMWAMVSGALLPNRGAVIPALASTGLTKEGNTESVGGISRGCMADRRPAGELARVCERATGMGGASIRGIQTNRSRYNGVLAS